MEYVFSVAVNDGEIEIINAQNLKQAKKKFKELHPHDYKKIECITSNNGYEEML